MIRTATLLPAVAGLALLSACGGGGDDGLAAPDPIPTVAQAATAAAKAGSVATAADARKAANLALPLLLINVVSTGSAKMDGVDTETSPAKATVNCGAGGSTTDSQQTKVDVGSPYTSQRFTLDVLSHNACKEASQTASENLVTGQTGLTRQGTIGDSRDNVRYFQNGESAAVPLRIAVQHEPRVAGGASFTVTTETYGIFHLRFDGQRSLREVYHYRQGLVTGTESGQRFDGAFLLQQGLSPGNRVRAEFVDNGEARQGPVAFALLSAPASRAAGCGNGSYTVSNVAPVRDLDPGEGRRYEGTLRLTAGGQTATYVLSGNGASGTVEITAGDGSKTTISQADLLEGCPVSSLF